MKTVIMGIKLVALTVQLMMDSAVLEILGKSRHVSPMITAKMESLNHSMEKCVTMGLMMVVSIARLLMDGNVLQSLSKNPSVRKSLNLLPI